MKIPVGIIIVIGILLLSIFLITDFIFPDVICKIIHRSDVKTSAGQYNPDLLSDICSGIT
jgi:hypothetical protein